LLAGKMLQKWGAIFLTFDKFHRHIVFMLGPHLADYQPRANPQGGPTMLSRTFRILSILVLTAVTGCGKTGSGKGQSFGVLNPEVDLMDVSNSNCLDIGKFFETVRSKPIPARKIIQDVSFAPFKGNHVPYNFSLRVAYAHLAIEDKKLNEMEEFTSAVQTDGESGLVWNPAGGEVF
jgi:hypothetical protein